MNTLKRACLCGLIYIVFAISFVASAAKVSFEAAVNYIPEHNQILLGEPLYVTFSVTNKGANKFYFETGGDYRSSKFYYETGRGFYSVRSGRFAFNAVDSNGVTAKDPNPDTSGMGGLSFLHEVKPHSTYSEKLFLPLWIKFDHAGQYRIHAERPLQLYAESSFERGATFTNSGTFNFYVTVLPANSNLLGKRIQELGRQTKSRKEAYDAALALAYIDDERVIPYLLQVVDTYKGQALYPAIEGLGRHPSADGVRALVKILDNSKYDYAHYQVMEALADMKSPEAKAALRKSLDSSDPFTRETAAKFLEQTKLGVR
jgi:hypothetical protein